MAHNEILAQRIRQEMDKIPGLQEKKMFGGVGFLIAGNMACGVHGEDLIVRVGAEAYQAALGQPHTKPFDMTGRPMSGWIVVTAGGYESDGDLRSWVERGVEFARSLPAK
jgi:TfoX/Sxy family transcriptional regulator of competence genes